MRFMLRTVGLGILALAAITSARAAVVTSTADSGAGSLRAALAAAASGETITFAVGLPATITLASELPITQDVTIAGPGAALLGIAGGSSRLFHLDTAPKTVTLSGVTLVGGQVTGDGGAIYNEGGNLTLSFVQLLGNHATGTGGAIFNKYNDSGNQLFILNSTLALNTANKSAAIDFIGYQLVIANSTITSNTATDSAGAINVVNGYVFLYNSTIARNHANFVGGIASQSTALTITSSALSGNTDSTGINDLNRTGGGNSFVYATQSLFSENFANVADVLNGSNVANIIGVDAGLDAAAQNGGPTVTLRPLSTSPLRRAGSNPQAYAFDQRGPGFARDAGGVVDIGAIQYVAPLPVVLAAPVPVLAPAALAVLALLLAVAATGVLRKR